MVFDVGGITGSVEVSIKVGEGELHFVFLCFCAFFLRVSFLRVRQGFAFEFGCC